MNSVVRAIEQEYFKKDVPQFNVGDVVKVFVKVVEGDKERLQSFEGTVIARKNGSVRETFTVRRVAYDVGIERVFPLHSPRIERVEVVRKGKVRRAKLYYLRGLSGKAAKIKEIKDFKKHTKDVAKVTNKVVEKSVEKPVATIETKAKKVDKKKTTK